MNARLSAVLFGSASAGVALLALLDAAAKGFVLLAVACAAALAMRRAAASARHLVWVAALACALVLPVCSWALPGWRVLPAWMRWETVQTAVPSQNGTDGTHRTYALPPVASAPSVPFVASIPSAPSIARPAPRNFRISASALLAIWAAGSALLLAPLVWSVFALARVSRRASTGKGHVAAQVAAIADELGLRRSIRILLGDADAMPMVWGIFRAHLLLPSSSADWPEARLRSVLLHELAHLRRRDPLALLVAQLALALHWFNPLAWFAVHRLRAEQERACDDFVMRHGIRPSEYATDLLAVATGLRAPPFAAAALTMAYPARLEGRIVGILDAARNRATLSRWLIASTVLLATAIALPLAMLRAADEEKTPAGAAEPRASETAMVRGVSTTADSAEISLEEKRGGLAFTIGDGTQAHVIVHEFGSATGKIVFRVSADDRQGKWWDQARVVRASEGEALFPELPEDWLPRGRVVFLALPAKRVDGSVVFAEIELASGKVPLAVRAAGPGEVEKARVRALPRTSPDTEIILDCRLFALAANAPTKKLILPMMAAQGLAAQPHTTLSRPYLTLQPGLPGTFDRMAGRAEEVTVTATMAGSRVQVAGSVLVRFIEGKFVSAADAQRQTEDFLKSDARTEPGQKLRAEFSAILSDNDALVVPIPSDGMFPETLVASMTALPRRLPRVRWQPPGVRSPIALNGWVLTWPRAEQEWFASNFDYAGLPAMIAHCVEKRKDTTSRSRWSEAVGGLDQSEVEKLLAAFRLKTGVLLERVEPFSAKQDIPGSPTPDGRTHFSAAGEGGSVQPRTDEKTISLSLGWDSPVLARASASDGYGLISGTSLCVLLPGSADPEKIRMLVLRCVNPDAPTPQQKSPLRKDGAAAKSKDATSDVAVAPVTPRPILESGKTDIALEVQPVVGPDQPAIELSLFPQAGEFEGFINYGSPINPTGVLNGGTRTVITANIINQPVFNSRKVTTRLSMFDGQTVLIGGLKDVEWRSIRVDP